MDAKYAQGPRRLDAHVSCWDCCPLAPVLSLFGATLLFHTGNMNAWHTLHTTDWYVTLICVPWLINMWHDSLIYDITWLIDMWYDSGPVDRDSYHSYTDIYHSLILFVHMWHDSGSDDLVRYASLICDMTRWYVTWLIDTWRDSLIYDMTHWYVTWLINMWHDSLNQSCHIDQCRLIGLWLDWWLPLDLTVTWLMTATWLSLDNLTW